MPLLPPPPYCGLPPVPDQLWSRWNLDPVLIAIAVGVLALYAVAAPRATIPSSRRLSFYVGCAITTAAVVSPLCPLSVALFGARVGQHMLLAVVAAPLVALGRPLQAVAAWRGRSDSPSGARRVRPTAPLWAATAFAVALWGWHAPGLYEATFHSDLVYWAMHASLFGAALWLWSALIEDSGRHLAATAAATALTSVQMGVLGALITFAPQPLYGAHLLTTWAWGLTPLEDQQLGGAIMWAPSGMIFVGGLALAFIAMMRRAAPPLGAPAAI
jgi:putative membrane protein